MKNTEYDPKKIEKWLKETNRFEEAEEGLKKYLKQYAGNIRNKKQRQHFETFVKGLFSPLLRKSLEPIALSLRGEKSVRSMQQFFSRAPLNEAGIRKTYQHLLSDEISCEGSMLSVDDTSFVKKGSHSIGVKRQYCGRLGKRENCQVGVFIAYAGDKGYGLVDGELYIPKEWYEDSHTELRKECHLPVDMEFATKNQIAQKLLNQILESGSFQIQWVGCDAAYGNDHKFLDGLRLPEGVWYCAATNSKERVFQTMPQMNQPEKNGGKGRPGKHAIPSIEPVSVKSVAEDSNIPWTTVSLKEGTKGPIIAERKIIRCVACREDGNRSYVKPGSEIWLYLRKYRDGTIKYFLSNAPADIDVKELDRAVTLRWPIEQCFEECKSFLGMAHYEGRTYQGWNRHMLFVMIAHLFATQIKEYAKKRGFQ